MTTNTTPKKSPKHGLADLSGLTFGRWHALHRAGPTHYECRCECGIIRLVPGKHLRSGVTKSCGCSRKGTMKTSITEHGVEWQAKRQADKATAGPRQADTLYARRMMAKLF